MTKTSAFLTQADQRGVCSVCVCVRVCASSCSACTDLFTNTSRAHEAEPPLPPPSGGWENVGWWVKLVENRVRRKKNNGAKIRTVDLCTVFYTIKYLLVKYLCICFPVNIQFHFWKRYYNYYCYYYHYCCCYYYYILLLILIKFPVFLR